MVYFCVQSVLIHVFMYIMICIYVYTHVDDTCAYLSCATAKYYTKAGIERERETEMERKPWHLYFQRERLLTEPRKTCQTAAELLGSDHSDDIPSESSVSYHPTWTQYVTNIRDYRIQ